MNVMVSAPMWPSSGSDVSVDSGRQGVQAWLGGDGMRVAGFGAEMHCDAAPARADHAIWARPPLGSGPAR